MQKLKILAVALITLGMASCCPCGIPISQKELSQENMAQETSSSIQSPESSSTQTTKPL